MTTSKTIVGDNISRYRKSRKLTKEDFAGELSEKFGLPKVVTDRAVSKWESGESYPQTEYLIALSKMMGVTLDELLKSEIENFDFDQTLRRSKTKDLSDSAGKLLDGLCRRAIFDPEQKQKLDVYFKIACAENGVSLLSDRFYYEDEAEKAYIKATAEIYRELRLRDFLSCPEQSAEELIKYTDIDVVETDLVLTPILYAYRETPVLPPPSDDGETDVERIIERLVERGIEEREWLLEHAHCNTVYFQKRHIPFSCLFREGGPSKVRQTKYEKQLLAQSNKLTEKIFGELFAKGLLQRDDADSLRIMQFGDSCADDVEEFSVMDFCAISLKVLLTPEEICEFLSDRFRESIQEIINK